MNHNMCLKTELSILSRLQPHHAVLNLLGVASPNSSCMYFLLPILLQSSFLSQTLIYHALPHLILSSCSSSCHSPPPALLLPHSPPSPPLLSLPSCPSSLVPPPSLLSSIYMIMYVAITLLSLLHVINYAGLYTLKP